VSARRTGSVQAAGILGRHLAACVPGSPADEHRAGGPPAVGEDTLIRVCRMGWIVQDVTLMIGLPVCGMLVYSSI